MSRRGEIKIGLLQPRVMIGNGDEIISVELFLESHSKDTLEREMWWIMEDGETGKNVVIS